MKITYSTVLVLEALARGYRYGFDILDATNLPSGTVYPILRRFENEGLVTSQWEAHSTATTCSPPTARRCLRWPRTAIERRTISSRAARAR
jgi:PadR family transcriptional regulator PadR